ncbi:amino acid permease [Thermoactinomyces sp. CICC 10521]|uniref:amino acid permease n=1 Tax=Thermoactinomyces sp. CICC 10521 TaxID=2767426 RepID=UPI0018DC8B92|nr:amino acid permease [Thermoactinomyces sp. CICC 10521]MBH8609312.1 amino acid permease [Thermoactinomyces sp. CICC 10521]
MKEGKQPLSVQKPQVFHQKKIAEQKQKKGMSEGQLVFIGVASILGAGFFLTTATTIRETGISILLSYLVGVFAVWAIFDSLGAMIVTESGSQGSFIYYVEKYLGTLFGFTGGWIYWAAGVLAMSSEITGISIFTQKWLPSVPIWMLSTIYTLLALGINLIGMNNYGRIESFFAVVKTAALVIFIGVVFYFILGGRVAAHAHFTRTDQWFAHGLPGFLTSLSMMFFTFGGIVATGMASAEVENPRVIPSAFRKIVLLLAVLYLLSLFAILYAIPLTKIVENQSPMITILTLLRIPYADAVLNLIMILAAFSTAIAAMFGVSHILVSLSKREEAPSLLAKINKRGVPFPSLIVTTIFVFLFIVASYFLPGSIYEILTTSAGVVYLFLWGMILYTYLRFRRFQQESANEQGKVWGIPWRFWLAILILTIALVGSVFDYKHLMSMLISVGFVLIAGFSYFILIRRKGTRAAEKLR